MLREVRAAGPSHCCQCPAADVLAPFVFMAVCPDTATRQRLSQQIQVGTCPGKALLGASVWGFCGPGASLRLGLRRPNMFKTTFRWQGPQEGGRPAFTLTANLVGCRVMPGGWLGRRPGTPLQVHADCSTRARLAQKTSEWGEGNYKQGLGFSSSIQLTSSYPLLIGIARNTVGRWGTGRYHARF